MNPTLRRHPIATVCGSCPFRPFLLGFHGGGSWQERDPSYGKNARLGALGFGRLCGPNWLTGKRVLVENEDPFSVDSKQVS